MSRLLRRCLLVFSCVAVVTPGTAQKKAGPPAEHQGEHSSLIDRQTPPGNPQDASAHISPNGTFASLTNPYKGGTNVRAKEREGSFDAAKPATADTTEQATASRGPSDLSRIDGSVIEPATLRYDVTMTVEDRPIDLSLTRTIRPTSVGGTETWTVVDERQTPRATVTDSLILDRSTLRPVARHLRGPTTLDVTYTDTSASGEMTVGDRTVSIERSFEQPTLAGGANNLLALAAMPLSSGFFASFPVFNERQQKVRTQIFTVKGLRTVKTPAGSFEAYLMLMTVRETGNSGTLLVRKTAPHYVLKARVEQSTPHGSRTITRTLSSMERAAASSGTQ